MDKVDLTYTQYITMMVLWEYGQMTVEPTEKGMQLRKQAVTIPAEVGKCIDLSPEEISTLYRLLYKVLNRKGNEFNGGRRI